MPAQASELDTETCFEAIQVRAGQSADVFVGDVARSPLRPDRVQTQADFVEIVVQPRVVTIIVCVGSDTKRETTVCGSVLKSWLYSSRAFGTRTPQFWLEV